MNLRSLPRLILLPAGAGIVCACMVLARADEPMEHTVYVAPGGDDENPGTRAAPLRTIGAAARAVGAGATVRVAPGTYRENIKSMASGSAAARIRYVSTVKWGAKIIGGGTEAVWENRGKHVEIAGFDVSGSGRAGILNYGSWVRIANNRVHDLALSGGCSGNGGGGIINANYKASDGEISGNVVHDIGVPGACPGVHGIYYANSRGNIYNNIVYRASAWGIHLWHAADQVINNIVVHNPHASIRQFCYPGQACIGAGNVVANNVVHANGAGVEMLVGRDTGTIADDPLFVDFRADGTGNYRLRRGSPALRRGLVAAAPPTDIEGARRSHGAAIDIGAYQNR
jgi:parallel beta-helix repeat protein